MNKFVIAGVQRSGTTMLSVMLNRHKDIFIEPKVISFRLISACKNMFDLLPNNGNVKFNEFVRWIIESDKTEDLNLLLDFKLVEKDFNLRELIIKSIDQRIKNAGKIRWGDKAPNIQHYFNDLLYVIPDIKVIHIIRDGRAVASSMSKRAFRNISLSAQAWLDGTTAGIINHSVAGKDQYKIIRYEDLLHDPVRIMKEVCKFLDLDYDPNVVSLSEQQPNEKSYVKQNFDLTKIDAWETTMSTSDLKRVEGIQKHMLSEFGYELKDPAIEFKTLSTFKMLRLNLWDLFKGIFRGKVKGMKNKEVIVYRDSFKSRLAKLVLRSFQEIFSLKINKALFPKRYYTSRKYKK